MMTHLDSAGGLCFVIPLLCESCCNIRSSEGPSECLRVTCHVDQHGSFQLVRSGVNSV